MLNPEELPFKSLCNVCLFFSGFEFGTEEIQNCSPGYSRQQKREQSPNYQSVSFFSRYRLHCHLQLQRFLPISFFNNSTLRFLQRMTQLPSSQHFSFWCVAKKIVIKTK